MDIHGHPCISMDIHGSLHIHGHPWISMDIHGYPWTSMEIHGHTWTSIDIHAWKSLKLHGYAVPNWAKNKNLSCLPDPFGWWWSLKFRGSIHIHGYPWISLAMQIIHGSLFGLFFVTFAFFYGSRRFLENWAPVDARARLWRSRVAQNVTFPVFFVSVPFFFPSCV